MADTKISHIAADSCLAIVMLVAGLAFEPALDQLRPKLEGLVPHLRPVGDNPGDSR